MPASRPIFSPVLVALFAAALLTTGPAAGAQRTSKPETGIVTGTVRNNLISAPLAGALVQLATPPGTDVRRAYNVRADSGGSFMLDDIAPGTYFALFGHPLLDSLGIEAPVVRTTVREAKHTRLDLGTPSARDVTRLVCGRPASDSTALLVGYVRDAKTGAPVADARVTFRWNEVVINRSQVARAPTAVAVTTSPTGWFAACGLPAELDLVARASHAPDTSGFVVMELPPGGVQMRDLYVGPASPADRAPTDSLRTDSLDTDSPRRGPARLRGMVRGLFDRPVAGARVRVWGSASETVSGASGQFTLDGLPIGSHTLEVRALGHLPSRQTVHLFAGRPADATVQLLDQQQFLDTTRIVAASTARDLTGFERRRKSGIGQFLTREDLDGRRSTYVADVLAGLNGVEIVPGSIGQGVYLKNGKGERCIPRVIIDGSPWFSGKELDQFVYSNYVRAIEVYQRSSQVPAEFVNLTDCGVIVIWTDERDRAAPRRPTR